MSKHKKTKKIFHFFAKTNEKYQIIPEKPFVIIDFAGFILLVPL